MPLPETAQTNPSHRQKLGPRVVAALDYDNLKDCESLAQRLDPKQCRLKVGKELFTACGPNVVDVLQKRGFDVFLDLKFHDIPVTVAKAIKSAASLGVWMVNVHASGGPKMLDAAADAVAHSRQRPLLMGVTVLTSMEQIELKAVGVDAPLADHVTRLAKLANDAGLDGVVCLAQEANILRTAFGRDFVLVTPGIRPEGVAPNDQRRIMTPREAILAGSHYLVVGRAITQAADPASACKDITQSIGDLN
jgi:orotidine-5'-phosphate decarboxylase